MENNTNNVDLLSRVSRWRIRNAFDLPLDRIPAAASDREYLAAVVQWLSQRPLAGSFELAALRNAENALLALAQGGA